MLIIASVIIAGRDPSHPIAMVCRSARGDIKQVSHATTFLISSNISDGNLLVMYLVMKGCRIISLIYMRSYGFFFMIFRMKSLA